MTIYNQNSAPNKFSGLSLLALTVISTLVSVNLVSVFRLSFSADPLLETIIAANRTIATTSIKSVIHSPVCVHSQTSCKTYFSNTTSTQQDVAREKPDQPKQTTKTLALADPVLIGGYRNQVFRLTSFVVYALQNGFDEILLPSIHFGNEPQGGLPVPFEILFDVDHWNSHDRIPHFVEYDASRHFDWNPLTGLFRDVDCEVLQRYYHTGPGGKDAIMKRLRNVSYTSPYAYGGGKQLGFLWYDYLKWSKKFPDTPIGLKDGTNTSFVLIEAELLNALKPKATIFNPVGNLDQRLSSSYLAVHPRVEPDMLRHNQCQGIKERNLTKIFRMIQEYEDFQSVDSVIVAANFKFMNGEMNRKSPYNELHQENRRLLNRALSSGLSLSGQKNVSLLVGGRTVVDNNRVPGCSLDLAGAALDFDLAINADMFLGTAISTWSHSVWKTRVLQGRGGGNYAFTPQGIEKMDGDIPAFKC